MNIARRAAVVCLVLAGISIAAPVSAAEPPLELDYQVAIADAVGDHIVAVAYDDAVAASQATDTFLASLYVPPSAARVTNPNSGSTGGGTTTGECTGFAIPDYIIQRESGGNPSARNPSGAYGCSQTMPFHYTSGQCQGLNMYTVEGQRECTWRISNGGTNLAPWAATR